MVKNYFKYLEENYPFLIKCLMPLKWCYDIYKYHIISEKHFLEKKFKILQGYDLRLDNPRTLNEKIQWLKLYDRRDLHTQCADKIAVRDYVKKIIGDKYLIPLIYVTGNSKGIDETILPDFPVIIKANHNSGGNIIIKDRASINICDIRKECKRWLKENYYCKSKEWQYKNIKPQILIEKLLIDKKGNLPNDFKLHCFNGKVVTIQVDVNRGSRSHFRNWYNREWRQEEFSWSSLTPNGHLTLPKDIAIRKPKELDEIILLAEKLSNPFYYARVDFYIIHDRIYFGEITFHHDGGFRPIKPIEWDYNLGKELSLPNQIDRSNE